MKKTLAASVMALSALSAHAADLGAYAFGTAGASYSTIERGDNLPSSASVNSGKQTDAAWEMGAGYRFDRSLAVEVSYADFGKSDANFNFCGFLSCVNGNLSAATTAVRASLLTFLPINDKVELFGRLSLNRVQTKVSLGSDSQDFNRTRAGFGFGARYALSKQLALRGEFEYLAGAMDLQYNGYSLVKTSGQSALKAGLSYQF
ncbi:porin [Chromobacterium subtsugae]|uniref:porin n=1 Tax=Chromobacterium subtsugae TaxID=251747 RepID=UPI00096C7922|nr:porin [Chromobacterium subtsugae]